MWGVAMIYQVENPDAVFRVDIDDIMVVIKGLILLVHSKY